MVHGYGTCDPPDGDPDPGVCKMSADASAVGVRWWCCCYSLVGWAGVAGGVDAGPNDVCRLGVRAQIQHVGTLDFR